MNKQPLPGLEVVITAHKEGTLLLPTCKSALAAIDKLLESYNVQVSIMLYLDKPDTLTKNIAYEIQSHYDLKVLEGENGDPGKSRISAISQSDKEFIALLDGDDLWSENWLTAIYELFVNDTLQPSDNLVLHPEYNLIFGHHSILVRQGNPNEEIFEESFFRIGNYWDALCFAARSLFLKYPYKDNDLEAGFAHEDYLWSCETYLAGVEHKLVKDTIHFKRRRNESVSVIANSKKVKVRPNRLLDYDHYDGNHR